MTSDTNPDGIPPPARDIESLAGVLDEAARHRRHYPMATAGREALGLPVGGELPVGLPMPERAVLWALDYHVETVDAQGQRRVRLAPAHESDDGSSDPPSVARVDIEVVEVWRALLDLVNEPAARARLHHLLFERGGPEVMRHGSAGAEAYFAAAAVCERPMDAVQDLTAATRLARAVGHPDLLQNSLEQMADLTERLLGEVEPPAGPVIAALRYMVGEPGCPDRVDDLLDRASTSWPDPNRTDRVLAVLLDRCATPDDRTAVWRRRVAVFTADADAATSKIMRATRLQQALQRADRSGDRELRRETAALLQTVRHDELEMMTFTATSRRYDEEFEQLVDFVIGGQDWQRALITFAMCGPLTADPDRNRERIRAQHAEFPLAAYFPTELLGPDGLPSYQGTSEQDRFDVDLTQWEAELITQWARVLGPALHAIPERHGLPSLEELVGFLLQWPGLEPVVAAAVARSLLRYWTGDSEGAAYTIVPRIEAIARTLTLGTERGMYRLQHEHVPGQFPPLGTLLPILQEEGVIDEAHLRFLAALLRHPAGLNLRNHMLHGFVGDVGGTVTAVLLHAALYLGSRGGDAP
ncbi:MAG TPA: hypothetical protein VNA20_05495 [Frankiaceae bacterium]|nr:hypothetical protein [Frankiaceae bacterium]